MITVSRPHGAAWEFLVLFGVIIFGPPIVKRARIPGLLGLLLGGYVIGPHGLGLIGSGDTTVPELGELGLLYLMFVAGVELDLSLLRIHRRAVVSFGLLTFTFPMVFGVLVGYGLGFGTAAALLLGSLLASHTLVLYPVARAAGIGSDPAVASVVGATVLTDTLALVVLAGVSGSSLEGGSPATVALQIGVGLVVLLAFTLVVLPRVVRLTFRYLGSERTVRYLLAVASFLAAATVAQMFGIEGIVGAFFAGLALNRLVPNGGPLMDRVEFFGSAVFIPVFLVSVGLLLDPSVIVQPTTLKFAALFILGCLGGKAVAAALARPMLGFSGPQAVMAYSLSSPQAAATLAATIIGFDIGLFSTEVVNAVLVLILVSVVVATVLAERTAPRIQRPEAGRRTLGQHVLVAVEDPSSSALAVAIAARLARREGGLVRALLVRRRSDPRAEAHELAILAQQGYSEGIDNDPRVVVDRSLADAVVNVATAEDASLVIAVESIDQDRPVLGRWTEAVAGGAPAPVVVVRGTASLDDGVSVEADGGGAAAEIATQIAEALRARGDLKPGEAAVTISPVASWEAFDQRAPAAGHALLLIPEPLVPPPPPAVPAPEPVGAL